MNDGDQCIPLNMFHVILGADEGFPPTYTPQTQSVCGMSWDWMGEHLKLLHMPIYIQLELTQAIGKREEDIMSLMMFFLAVEFNAHYYWK